MGSTTWTQADLEALESAIKQGVLKVDYNDRSVVYRSLAEMLQIRSLMRECLGLQAKSGRKLCCADKGTV